MSRGLCCAESLLFVGRLSCMEAFGHEFVVHVMALVCSLMMLSKQPESRVFSCLMIAVLYLLFYWILVLNEHGVSMSIPLFLFACVSATVVTADIYSRLKDSQQKRVLTRLLRRADELVADIEALSRRQVNVNVDCTARTKRD